jgi:acetolactate synthase-1/2/3 large subunit
VKDVNDLRAFCMKPSVATSGRPGPVVVDIPKDVQFATGTYTPPSNPVIEHKSYKPQALRRLELPIRRPST